MKVINLSSGGRFILILHNSSRMISVFRFYALFPCNTLPPFVKAKFGKGCHDMNDFIEGRESCTVNFCWVISNVEASVPPFCF